MGALVVEHWRFAAWFVMGLVLIGHYVLGGDLPFAMSCWAFIFPSGALAVASGLACLLRGAGR